MNEPTGIEQLVCADIAARQQLGIKKYGRTVAESQDDMLQHAYEEALDLAIYLKAELTRRANDPNYKHYTHHQATSDIQPSAFMVRLYNQGYHAGHEDTVEACFTPIHHTDMDTYHADVVAEIFEENRAQPNTQP